MPRLRRDGAPFAAPNKRKLNDLIVRRLKPQPGAYLVWDLQQRGLAINIHPTGRKTFKCIYSRQGRSRWYNLGAADAIGLADARKLASRVMFQVAEGKDPAAERRAERNKNTFAELAERYVEEYAKKRNKSWRNTQKLVARNLLPRWGKLPASDITRSDVRAMMASIEAPITANQTLASASAIFSWAIKQEHGGVKINPCHGVERNETKSRERVLSDGEIAPFWGAFGEAGLLQGSALKLILLTGQRPGEVLHLRREHITDGCWWTMPGEPVPALRWPGTKNGETHRIWLPQAAQALLAELGDETTGPVFSKIPNLDATMRAICKTLNVERCTPHDLRRTHGTTITALGFGRDAMNRVQNHKEGGIASVYDRHGYAEENKRIMESVAQRIMALVEGDDDAKVLPFVVSK